MKQLPYIISAMVGLGMACQPDPVVLAPSQQSGARVEAATASFTIRQKLGTAQDGSLTEISGVAQSRTNPGLLWVEEDSSNPSRVYLIDPATGATRATFSLPVSNRDWEDIAVGPGPKANTNYVYVADIGDNSQNHSKMYVYRFIEPSIAGKSLPYNKNLSDSDVQKLDFAYADSPRNCETFMIDPNTRDMYFISKEDNDKNKTNYRTAGVYRAAYPQQESGTNTVYRSNSLSIMTATGGDISANGQEVVIKNYDNVYYWRKSSSSQSLASLLQTFPTILSNYANANPKEPGGEAIGWKTDGTGFYTISEIKDNILAAIYFYPR